tara:strand:+ start:325 stop:747 length:423 start_codon:yes stop_codon:yes gene_type:complete
LFFALAVAPAEASEYAYAADLDIHGVPFHGEFSWREDGKPSYLVPEVCGWVAKRAYRGRAVVDAARDSGVHVRYDVPIFLRRKIGRNKNLLRVCIPYSAENLVFRVLESGEIVGLSGGHSSKNMRSLKRKKKSSISKMPN